MATKRLTMKYGIAAVVLALAVIGGSILITPKTAKAQTSFSVMLTDPPNVPEGTTKLEVVYSGIQLFVKDAQGNANWIASTETGTVDLLTLVGVSQTIAHISIPTGSTVEKIKFTITSAKATINDVVYPVTILSETLVLNLGGVKLDGTNAGALIDLRPKLLKINAIDADGAPISYYVLVPSALAVDKSNVDEEHKKVGAKHNLNKDEAKELDDEFEHANKNIDISATIKVTGDKTTLSVTFTNKGEKDATINGLEVHGSFKFNGKAASSDEEGDNEHSRSVTFRVTSTKLVPRIGGDDSDGNDKGLELKPGASTTLTFSDVIQMQQRDHGKASPITISLIAGNVYQVRASGEGNQSIDVTAS